MHVNAMSWGVLLGAMLVATVGCGKGEPAPVRVTGTVDINGKPLESGMIYFTATDGKPPAQGEVVNGTYTLESVPGERRVEIRNYVEVKGKKGPGGETITTDTIPPKYNTNSTLKATVTEAGPNEFNFKLDIKK
jgi:hypothetical protein